MSTRCKAYLRSIDRWVNAYALQVHESGVVHVLVYDGELGIFETDVSVCALRDR